MTHCVRLIGEKISLLVALCAVAVAASCQKSSDIVLINVAGTTDCKLARAINEVNAQSPKLIAIDLTFDQNLQCADLLSRSILQVEKLVLSSKIHRYADGKSIVVMSNSPPFDPFRARYGFVNANVDGDTVHGISRFATYEDWGFRKEYRSFDFSVEICFLVDTVKTAKFIQDRGRVVEVDFSKIPRNFRVLSVDQLVKKRGDIDLKNKIVIFGFLGPGDADRHRIPVGSSRGKYIYGVEHLANVAAQILESFDH